MLRVACSNRPRTKLRLSLCAGTAGCLFVLLDAEASGWPGNRAFGPLSCERNMAGLRKRTANFWGQSSTKVWLNGRLVSQVAAIPRGHPTLVDAMQPPLKERVEMSSTAQSRRPLGVPRSSSIQLKRDDLGTEELKTDETDKQKDGRGAGRIKQVRRTRETHTHSSSGHRSVLSTAIMLSRADH